MQFLWKYIDDFVGKGFDMIVIAELMFYASATFVPMALPLAVLLSSLMLFGNLGENYELAAIKSAGISLSRIFRPLVFTAIIISSIAFYFSNNVLPVANLKFRSLLRDVRQQKPAVQIDEGIFYSEIDNYVIRIGQKESDGITIHDVMLYDHRNGNGNTNVTIARDGIMEMSADKRYLVFTLTNGYNYDENIKKQQRFAGDTYPMQKTKFSKMVQRIDLSAFDFKKTDGGIFRNNYEMMNINQLKHNRDSLFADLDSNLIDFHHYVYDNYNFLKLYAGLEADTIYQKIKAEKKLTKPNNYSAKTDSIKAGINSSSKGILMAKKLDKEKPVDPEIIKPSIKFDTTKAFNDTILYNFSYGDGLRIVNDALIAARNASYHSEIIAQNKEAKEKLIAKHEIEWNRKFALSIACILFFFIGAPLGAIIRKGGLGTPLVMSTVLFVIYYVFAIVGEKSSKELAMSPFFGMWMSTLVFAPLGIFFTMKATADAPILDREFYIKFYEKVRGFLPKNKNVQ